MKKLFLFIFCSVLLQLAWGQARHTPFDPTINGFKFVNSFQNALPLDIRTGGLCGGMAYAALDYYNKHIPIPGQDYRPAERTQLQSYIYQRQMKSLTANLDKWAEVGANPDGARNTEFFEWGLKGSHGGRIQELKEFIDRGLPVPLGLQAAGGEKGGGNHQVLAIGYDMGRYRGDMGNYKGDFKIFCYDPNHPGRVMTLVPDLNKKVYYFTTGKRHDWRTYFVDKKYTTKQPPYIPPRNYPRDGKVYDLILSFGTGNDDLRGGRSNVDAIIHFFEGASQRVINVNKGAGWMRNYDQSVRIHLNRPVDERLIKDIEFITTSRGGLNGDNWDLDSLKIRALGGNVDRTVFYKNRGVMRFTGSRNRYVAVINRTSPVADTRDGKIRNLKLTIITGSDDLRGNKDNLNISVRYSNGTEQNINNVNHGRKWKDKSTQVVSISLSQPSTLSQIKRVVLTTTFSGGMGGDNWNMNKLVIHATGGGVNRDVYDSGGNPLFRFTGTNKVFYANF